VWALYYCTGRDGMGQDEGARRAEQSRANDDKPEREKRLKPEEEEEEKGIPLSSFLLAGNDINHFTKCERPDDI